jgi:predicted 3-demethylubiquinone-9 3-methyltransferase (glyoxalase superfamily)
MAKSVTPFLMFEGAAEEAVNLYVSLFRDSSIRMIERYRSGEGGAEGSVK